MLTNRTMLTPNKRMTTRLLGVENLERRLVLQGAPLTELVAAGAPAGAHSPAEAQRAEQVMIVQGFALEIEGVRGGDPDSAWETCSGGSLRIGFEPSESQPDELDSPTVRGPLAKRLGALGDEIARAFAFVTSKPARGVNEGSYEILENGAGKFKVEIDGCPGATANVESITVEDLVVEERETTTGADWDYRVYGPGDAHYGSITIRARADGGSSGEDAVTLDCSNSSNIRNNISVIAGKRDGSEARRFNIFDAFPTRWDPGDYSPSSAIICHAGDLLDGDAADTDQDAAGRGRNPQTGQEVRERATDDGSPPSVIDNVPLEARRGRNPQTGKEIRAAAIADAPLPPFARQIVDDIFAALGGPGE